MEGNTQNTNSAEGKQFDIRSVLKPLLIVLMVLFVLTSGMLGYLLGRNAAGGSGELIDTIVLAPGETAGETAIHHYLTGKVVYEDGTPCAEASVRLGEDKQDVTDELGKFFFSSLKSGEYSLEVLNESGEPAAKTLLRLDFSREGGISANIEVVGEAEFVVPENTRMLDITFTLDDDALAVQEGSSYFVTTDGEIVDFTGGSLYVDGDSMAVTPTGTVITSDGYVLLTSKETALTPPGGVQNVSTETENIPDIEIQEDGSAITDEGVSIIQDGTVITPDGEESSSDGFTVIEGETAEEMEELPQDSSPDTSGEAADGAQDTDTESSAPSDETDAESTAPESSDPDSGDSAGNIDPESSAPGNEDGAQNTDAEISEPEEEATPSPSPTPDGLTVESISNGLEWSQQSTIDLFKNHNARRTESVSGVEYDIIEPGSSGYYEFRLKNDNDFAIEYTIQLKEHSFNLPIGYSITDSLTNYRYMSKAQLGPADTVTSVITLEANSQRDYRIDWIWDYENRYNKHKQDAKETAIASQENPDDRMYIISVSINAAQVTVDPQPDDDTRYPGRR